MHALAIVQRLNSLVDAMETLLAQPETDERNRKLDELADRGQALVDQLPRWYVWIANAIVVTRWVITFGWLRGHPWPIP